MGKYEELIISENIDVEERSDFPSHQSGLYYEGKIYIKSSMSSAKKYETLLEEFAHHKLTYGDILDQSQFNNRKFENYARRYSYETSMPLSGIVEAFEQGVRNLYELANFFEITEGYALDCIEHYKKKYGLQVRYGEYLIRLEPLTIYKDL
ncbi:ImmA/IrrE family metallo-endopeptidase [Staphylococcus schleiferi subsp. coagulans]|uniref:ImmA/IrrE family metallo-endopeptidase n=1 Tax=Staphylococcus coagulans TaxID=74706 RepID=UPI0015FE77DF|nr:ImmA/IrrE family metallo-endopeptidase [Staphylococcus coagulans]MBA8760773.1 ImmA/IrrE family metallo-endopeptidase [Staphylococcus coagulans]MBA8769503.1 ImmA/IrrE family metallo-endopeptidase [Staphylococcus coagulans]